MHEDFFSGQFRRAPLPRTGTFDDGAKLCGDIVEGFKPVVSDIFALAVRQQSGFRKNDICVPDGAVIGMSVADVDNDLIVVGARQEMIPFAVRTTIALGVRVRKMGHDRPIPLELQAVRKEGQMRQFLALQDVTDIDIEAVAQDIEGD